MCGIAGFWFNQPVKSLGWFRRCLATLEDRGPDGSGQEILDTGQLVLGHTRLSIIDVSTNGRQPLSNEDGTVWITFNGEIYNFNKLRTQLIARGHIFRSATDTEVIVHAYEEWGRSCLEKLNGIFAFVIWDQNKEELFVARDNVGVKPLYFSANEKYFAFASQPKAIVSAPVVTRDISQDAFRDYLSYGYIPDPKCIFKGVEKLEPGHCLTVTRNGIRKERYWRLEYKPVITNFDEASEEIGSAVSESVTSQLTSDVPVGTLLSGGIDSTLITGIANKNIDPSFRPLRTFTLGFDEKSSDERSFAQVAANYYKTNHFVDELTASSFLQQLGIAIEAFDEPFDPNGPLPATRIAQLVQAHDTKVVLGGDGGDELFSGYLRYDEFNDYRREQRGLLDSVRRFCNRTQARKQDIAHYFEHEGACNAELLAEIIPAASDSEWAREATISLLDQYDDRLPPVTACQMMDFHHYLPGHILTKVDRATMHFGVEARVPLLATNLVELAFSIDCRINYRNGERKAALKDAAAKHLPPELLTGRKKGFSSPMAKWLDQSIIEWATKKIESGILVDHGLIRKTAAPNLTNRSTYKRFRAFWLLLTAELWAERWLQTGAVELDLENQFQLETHTQ